MRNTIANNEAVQELINLTGWKLSTVYNKLWYRNIKANTLTLDDVYRVLDIINTRGGTYTPPDPYVLWENILPLSKALERGIYTEDGTLNVFKDPNQMGNKSK